MTTRKKRISVYLPDSLYQTLIAYQEKQTLNSASSAVVEILAQFFQEGDPTNRYATVEQMQALEEKVAQLSELITALTQVGVHSTPSADPTAKSVTPHSFPQVANLAQLSGNTFGKISFEDVEDEPDEILYDFLEPEYPPNSSR